MRSPLLPRAFLSLLLFLGVWLGPDVVAADDAVAVPDVLGRSADEATTVLEGAGFKVVAVEIADGTPGKVHSQVPPADTYLSSGADVEIRVGIALRIQTDTPDVRGKSLAEAVEAYAGAYVIEVEVVEGDEAQQGKVLDQDPKPGEALLFRGILRLIAVQAAAPASVIVPEVIGKSETDARTLIDDAGLRVSVTYVQDPVAGPGIVVSQEPVCCGQILVGGLVALRVNGEAPAEPEPDVVMPDVQGLTMHQASQTVLLSGLVPRVEFQVDAGGTAWMCIGQHPAAGESVGAGTNVRLVVSLPSAHPSTVRVPPLYGLTSADATAVLDVLQLSAHVIEQNSLYTPGRVFGQSPASGTFVSSGSSVTMRVAKTPPGGWTPVGVLVPSVIGKSPIQAFVKLLAAGLWGHEKHHVSPGAALGLVDSQYPAAGSVVGPGTKISFYLPKSTTVPALLGLTKAHALQKLLQAELNGAAQGPAFGFGATKVTNQSVVAGSKVAQGTTIQFAYVYTGGVGPIKVKVPLLLGKTKSQAVTLLQLKGLNGNFVGPIFGIGATKVTWQSPAANTLVLLGSTVNAKYKFVGPQILKVKVPHLLGKTKLHAAQALQAKGLNGHFVGPNFGFGPTKVTSQNPAAGVFVNKGTIVNVHYVYSGGLQPLKVKVPFLIGKSKGQAASALQLKGLHAKFLGPNFGFGTAKVSAQNPAANTLVPAGSIVKVTIKFSGGPLGFKVKVPNLHNKTKAKALAALQNKGLKVSFHGPQFGFGSTKVVHQNPAAGKWVNKGSTVHVKYVFSAGVVIPFKVKVPHVVGKTRNQAKAIVEAAGLKAKFFGPMLGIGTPRVVSQNPHGNVLVTKGSTVKMVLKFQ